jgi:ribonuclease J
MNFNNYRGTKEIGGTILEVWTEIIRILLEFEMPLVYK